LRYAFAALYLAVAAIHIYACGSRRRLMLRRVTKCTLMPLVAVCYILFAKTVSPLVLAAIFFGFAGDFLLLLTTHRWAFPAGIAAFSAGHLFYIASFLRALPYTPSVLEVILLVVVNATYATVLLIYLWKGIPRKLRPPSILYVLIIGSMASCAFVYAFSGASTIYRLAAVGGLLFVASDSMLSIDAFRRPIPHRSILVMSTYIAAQTLIVSSLAFA
jgi:uncharacterized membrane protein YhhN